MDGMTMQEAVEFFRRQRGCRDRVQTGEATELRLARLSFVVAGVVGAGVWLLGLIAAPVVGQAWPAWAASPAGFAFQLAWLALGASVLFYRSQSRARELRPKNEFALYLGDGTGKLLKLGHRTSAEKGEPIVLRGGDASQNIVVSGGISSGKTTKVIYPLLVQLLDQDCGGLILDVKSNFAKAVAEAAAAVGVGGSRVEVIGPGRTRMNLIAGLAPETAAANLKSALLLGGQVGDDPIWINTAGDWMRSGLGVLSQLPGRYSLEHLYRYLFEAEYAALAAAEAEAVLEMLEGNQRSVLQSYLDYRNIVFENFDARFVAGVRATVSQLLAPFTHPDVVEAFCTEPPVGEGVEFRKILEGTVFLVDMSLARWGYAGQTAYTFLKLRFFNLVQERQANMRRNLRRVFLMCDEYQNVICASKDGLSDLNFWDKSREAGCIGIVSWQGVASVYAQIGDRDTADAIMQNFRQRIYFLSEDPHTLDQVSRVLGKVEVERQTMSDGSSSTVGRTTRSTSSSTGKTDKTLVDAQVMRQLGPREGIVVLNLAGRAKDDVLTFTPVFVEPQEATEEEAQLVGAV